MKRTESKDLVSFLVIDHSIHEKETVQTDAQLILSALYVSMINRVNFKVNSNGLNSDCTNVNRDL